MDDYISKPVRRVSLLAMVEKWTGSIGAAVAEGEEPETLQGRNGPMDYARAVQEFEGDEDFLREVIQGFLDTVDGQLLVLEQALAVGNAETVAREAHAIKGGAANLTADSLAAAAHELENLGRNASLQGGIGCLDTLRMKYRELADYHARNIATHR